MIWLLSLFSDKAAWADAAACMKKIHFHQRFPRASYSFPAHLLMKKMRHCSKASSLQCGKTECKIEQPHCTQLLFFYLERLFHQLTVFHFIRRIITAESRQYPKRIFTTCALITCPFLRKMYLTISVLFASLKVQTRAHVISVSKRAECTWYVLFWYCVTPPILPFKASQKLVKMCSHGMAGKGL